MPESDAFADFVRERSPDLLRAAWLLTGDWHTAHDLVQTALEKSWPRWGRRIDHPEAYVRRVLLTTYLSWRRRRWISEIPTGQLPEIIDPNDEIELRQALLGALAALTPRQRAVIVLRYFADLSEADAAAALGCSVGHREGARVTWPRAPANDAGVGRVVGIGGTRWEPMRTFVSCCNG